MASDCKITQALMDRQRDVFRVACDPRRYGNTLAAISATAGIPSSSLRGYAAGTTEMPLSALHKLADVLPHELLSTLAPPGMIVLPVIDGIDHDEIAPVLQRYLSEKHAAHCPNSPGGREIAPCEDVALRTCLTEVSAKVAA